ncbi:MAG: FapA family protein [Lachnospiraceae bacterium]
MNGFFQLSINEQGISLTIYHPTDGGKEVEINEVIGYLQSCNVQYDITLVNRAIQKEQEEQTQVLLSPLTQNMLPVSEVMIVNVNYDMMSASMRFYAPSIGGACLSKADIIATLNRQNVVFGIEDAVIDAFLLHRQYCTDIIVAQGKAPRQGQDAKIEYCFNTDLRARPTLKEDGGVDFFHLNTLNHCKAGDILAKLTKEDPGDTGTNVMGTTIRPSEVKRTTLQYSHNIDISEDRTVLTSRVNGHVCLVEGKVFVSDIYEVANVDNATGNIEYEGSVVVSGNVCSNFRLVAHGNIEVRGVVEGAYIEADGNIIIARGMSGMMKGTLKAGGNIVAKFIENSTIEAGGYVEAESILHSRVMARTEINVLSRKGFITGGSVSATSAINVKNLGSPMGADTVAEVGINPVTKKRYIDLQKEVIEIQKTLQTIEPILLSTKKKLQQGEKLPPDRMKYVQTLAIANKQKKDLLSKDLCELDELQIMLDSNTAAQITVSGAVYSGTKIVISDSAMTVTDTMKYCRFVKRQGEVQMTSL